MRLVPGAVIGAVLAAVLTVVAAQAQTKGAATTLSPQGQVAVTAQARGCSGAIRWTSKPPPSPACPCG